MGTENQMDKPKSHSPSKRKRPTVTRPKVKGCYECSQRRIDCDRGQPTCSKCRVKGLQCSGLGIRYRFESGIASRGKFVGKTTPHDIKEACRRHDVHRPRLERKAETESEPESKAAPAGALARTFDDQTEPYHQLPVATTSSEAQFSFILALDHLYTVVSTKIAPYMQAVDDPSSGWRKLILPISLQDEVVMDAVVAAAAFHISANSNLQAAVPPPVAQESFTRAISGLLRRQDMQSHDPLTNGFSVVAVLALMTATMITGSPDFRLLYRMLKAAFEVTRDGGGTGDRDLDNFLLLQFNKYRVYGEPLVSETDGIEAVKTQAAQSFDCLHLCAERHPEHVRELANVRTQVEQAYEIYLRRAQDDLEDSESLALVERAKALAEDGAALVTGQHVLIWPTFILAAESSTPEHRAFFTARLRHFYGVNGFTNNLKALALLDDIWHDPANTKWTTILPKIQTFVV